MQSAFDNESYTVSQSVNMIPVLGDGLAVKRMSLREGVVVDMASLYSF